jgi:hypothetical protein
MFVANKPYQPSLLFASKARSLPSSTALKRYARLLAMPINIRLGLKGLPGTNTLAYYEHS